MTDRIDDLLEEADRTPFVGWDFSWLDGRLESDPLPWDYTGEVSERARSSQDLLDLGTGGGEWLASLPYRPGRTVATEAWPPNVAIARRRLEPLGIAVVPVDPARDNTGAPLEHIAASLPFPNGSFHLIVDRHESFEPSEVARVLAPGGWFITQQVDAGNDTEYRALFGIPTPKPRPEELWASWLPGQLQRVGLRVIEHDSAPLIQRIHDVGALAWNLKAITWMVPGFSISRYRGRLRELQEQIDRNGPLTVRQRRFWVRAQKTV